MQERVTLNKPLRIDAVSICFGSARALAGCSLELVPGSYTALVGPNGSGKTTLLRVAAGHQRPDSGAVFVNGRSLYAHEVAARSVPGFAPGTDALPGMLTGRQSLAIFAEARGLGGIDKESLELAAQLGLSPWLDRLIRSYSLGTRQKVSVLLALMGAPQVVLLDEVFNGLDPASALVLKKHLRRLVTERGLSVLLATHSLDVVATSCDRMVLLAEGRIVRNWSADELAGMRGPGQLEISLAAMTPHGDRDVPAQPF